MKNLNIPLAILTRNSKNNMEHFVERFEKEFEFKDVFRTKISREFQMNDEFFKVKPDPYSLHCISKEWNIPVEDLLMVGDSMHDVEIGKNAGAKTCLLITHAFDHKYSHEPDYKINELIELKNIL